MQKKKQPFVALTLNASGTSSFSSETCEMLHWGAKADLLFEMSVTSPVSSVAMGDINGDGRPDLAIGSPTYQKGKIVTGKIDIYLGGNTLRPVTLTGGDCPIGYNLVLTDLNHDGADEIVTGNPACNVIKTGAMAGTAQQAGKVMVYSGGATIATTPALTVQGTWAWQDSTHYYGGTSERLGSTLAKAGDINGDGFQDLAIGVPYGGMARSGAVRVLLGGPTLSSLGTYTVNGPVAGEYLGITLAAAGDINGDGLKGIAVGSQELSNFPATLRLRPPAYVVLGGATPQRSGKIGSSSFITGLDFNGEGFSDLKSGEDLFYGGSPFPSGTRHLGCSATDNLGDLNGDGAEELLSGSAIVFGSKNFSTAPFAVDTAISSWGRGDWNKDGLPDLIQYDSTAAKVRIYSIAPFLSLPRINLTSPVADVTSLNRVVVAGKLTGAVSQLRMSGQGVAVAADGSFQQEQSLADGSNQIEILAVAPDGRISKLKVTIEPRLPSPLTVTILSPADGARLNANAVTVGGTVSDPSALVQVNGITAQPQVSGLFSVSITLAEGLQTITATAANGMGQNAAHTINVTVATTGALYGVITNNATSGPVAGATVTLTDAKAVPQTTQSAADGIFSLQNLAAGTYSGTIAKAGYLGTSFTGSITADHPIDAQRDIVWEQQFTKLSAAVKLTTPEDKPQTGELVAIARYRLRDDYQSDLSTDPPDPQLRWPGVSRSVSAPTWTSLDTAGFTQVMSMKNFGG